MRLFLRIALCALLAACAAPPSADDAGTADPADAAELAPDASAPDASSPDAGSKAAACASTFGHALTNAFGRLDGTVVAIVKPSDQQCTLPNRDHVVLQVKMNGDVYRMVVNVLSTSGDPDVRFTQVIAPLPGGPWQEGWHPNAALDYAADLHLHAGMNGFAPLKMDALVSKLDALIPLGDRVSVFAQSSGPPDNDGSAHLIHRNGSSHDGAIVLGATTSSPTLLVFHFANQAF